ncbi:MAG: ABC transporter permease, partial [Actinomycetota bacterium]|nr:ABC transporter permease [Actinomycetota bacterium]
MRAEFALAWRLVSRQWRAGELHLMIVAAVLAVTVATMLAAFGDRLERALVHRAADMLGADLVLTGSKPPSAAALGVARQNRLAVSQAVDFSTMLAAGPAPDDQVLLVAVRAADERYPLRGELRTGEAPGDARVAQGPAPGTVWVERRVRDDLGVNIGDRVGIGYTTLEITALVSHEPDRAGDFTALSPRVLMNRADLDATRVIQPGSRVRYRTLFAGDDAAVAATRAALETARAPNEEIVDVRTGSRRTASALSRAMQFLGLAGVFGVILCGAAIGIAA